MYNLSDSRLISFPLFTGEKSFLSIYEGEEKVPFRIHRVFTIKAVEKSTRGFHAHKECSQLLVVLQGGCKVTCDDGTARKDILLNTSSEGLLIPPTVWAEQDYQPDTILMVLTDKPYDESDYIRDYDAFLKFRNIR